MKLGASVMALDKYGPENAATIASPALIQEDVSLAEPSAGPQGPFLAQCGKRGREGKCWLEDEPAGTGAGSAAGCPELRNPFETASNKRAAVAEAV